MVDDGSTDNSAEVAAAYGAEVIRHPVNRGLAAARNTGIEAARSPLIATLDDDCEPDPKWAERLADGFVDGVVGVGGTAVAGTREWVLQRLSRAQQPAGRPSRSTWPRTPASPTALRCYLMRNARPAPSGNRAVHAFATANGAFRVDVLRKLGGFDERFRSDEGGEDLDLCLRIGDEYGPGALRFEPSATLLHHFDTDPRCAAAPISLLWKGSCEAVLQAQEHAPYRVPLPCAHDGASHLVVETALAAGRRAPGPPVALFERLPDRPSATLPGATFGLLRQACGGGQPERGLRRRPLALAWSKGLIRDRSRTRGTIV